VFYDDDELEAVRRRSRRRIRLLVVLIELVVCALVIVPVAILDRFYRPGALQPLLDRAVAGTEARLTYGDLVMLPVGRWLDPGAWRFAVTGLAFRADDPKKPEWSVRRITMALPIPRPSAEGRVIHWSTLHADGLAIHAHQQRPPEPWTPKAGGLVVALAADRVEIHGASFDAPEDPPLGVVAAPSIDGVLERVVFRPGSREVSADGAVTAPSFRTGAITVTDVKLPTFRLERSSLHLDGTVDFAGSVAKVRGDVRRFHVRSEVTLDVTLQGASVGRIVETATGRDSPFSGKIDLDLHVEAGGERPRGAAMMDGLARVYEGRIQLDPRTRYLVLDALRLVPWVRLNAWKQVELEEMRGRATLTRGTVTLKDLSYPVGQRDLRLDGTISPSDLYLLVRLGPPPAQAVKPGKAGLGVVIEGARGRPASEGGSPTAIRLAKKEELLKQRPWLPLTREERRALRAEAEAAARGPGRRR
jgi:hypothetical protein